MILILFLTCLPGRFIPEVPALYDLLDPDKLVHIILFAVLVFLWLRGLKRPHPLIFLRNNAVLLTLNLGVLLGGLTELLQAWFIPNRTASIYDFIVNVAGCFLGWWLFVMKEKKSRN